MEVEKKSNFKKRLFQIGFVVLILLLLGWYFFFQPKESPYVTDTAQKRDIIQTVDVTGTIKADPSIDLHFQKSGTVEAIYVTEGEETYDGQILAELENESLALEVQRAQANLDYAIAQYNQTKSGAKAEEIQIAESELTRLQAELDQAVAELDNAQTSGDSQITLAQIALKQANLERDTAKTSYEQTKELAEAQIAQLQLGTNNTQSLQLQNAYITAQLKLESLITIMQDSLALGEEALGLRGTLKDFLTTSQKNNVKRNYYEPAKAANTEAVNAFSALPAAPTNEEIDAVIQVAIPAGQKVLTLLTQITIELQKRSSSNTAIKDLIVEITNQSTTLVNAIIALQEAQNNIATIISGSGENTQTAILDYQLQIDEALKRYNQAEIASSEAAFNLEQAKNNAALSVSAAQTNIALLQAAIEQQRANLALKRSPARSVDLAPLAAQISQAEIMLKIVQKEFADSQLVSPINGVVSKIHGELGENISLTETSLSPFITIHGDKLIVEANVPETDIVKIEDGNAVEMTIDAFDFTEKFHGEVIKIADAETVIQGVIYYEIDTAFEVEDERIKSGMTVNLEIETNRKENVLTVPLRAVKIEDSTRYVEVLRNSHPEKVTITTGLSDDTYVEVLSGIQVGDKIVTFVK